MIHEADAVHGPKYAYLKPFQSQTFLRQGHNRRGKGRSKKPMTETDRTVAAAFHEVYADEPAVVAKTRRKKGAAAAKAQTTAIALAKARAQGARIPKQKGTR